MKRTANVHDRCSHDSDACPKHCAKETALAYFGSRSDGKLEVPTYNNTTPYI